MFFNWLLFFLLIITRFWGLAWGRGFFFHPDENNMAWAVERLSWPELNPQFFAYGHFPLYLVYFSHQILKGGQAGFSSAIYWLRFWSAVFSSLTVVVGWFLGKEIFNGRKWPEIFSLLLIFAPGLIQMAHFGTTESILAFVGLGLVYFSIKLVKRGKENSLLILSLISAIGLATKVSALLFLPAPLGAILGTKKRIRNLILWGGLTLILTIVFSPYNFLNFKEFFRIVKYESDLARGIIPVFYTRQFIETKGFIFQLGKILPWVLGLPAFVLAIIGSVFFLEKGIRKRKILKKEALFLILGFFPWLWFNGFLFVKWVRFMTPILPFFILIAVWFLKKLEKKIRFVFLPLLFFSLAPGFLFMKVYFSPDIRIQASQWLVKNLPPKSMILSEAGNVASLPFKNHDFQVVDFDFYQLDENIDLEKELLELVGQADYILLPSRRVFANHSSSQFPKTAWFYNQLFSGNLGFYQEKEFKVFNSGEELLLGSDLTSEESWTVFDHPTIRLFKKNHSKLNI